MQGPGRGPGHRRDLTAGSLDPAERSRSIGSVSARSRFAWWIAAAFAGAVALRWAVTLRYYRHLPLGWTDNFYYHFQATLLAEGQGFSNPFARAQGIKEPTAGHPPLYSLYLAMWSLLGAGTPLWHRLASGLASAGAVIPVSLTVLRLAGARAGIVAGFGAAAYPALWMNDGLILAESLYIPLVATALWQAHRVVEEPSRRRVIEFSVILAAATLTRGEASLLFLVLLVPLVAGLRTVAIRERIQMIGLAAVAAAVVMAPWVGRNLTIFDEPTLLGPGPGFVLELGNCDATYSGPLLGYWSHTCDNRGDQAWPDPEDAARPDYWSRTCGTGQCVDGDESAIGADKLARARDYIGDHIAEQPKVIAARVGRLFGLFRPLQTADFDVFFERRIASHVKVALWSHWALSLLAVGGAVTLWQKRKPVLPAAALAGVAAFTAAVSFGITRYRVSADVAAVVLAGVGIGALLDRWRRRSRSEPLPGADPAEPIVAACEPAG